MFIAKSNTCNTVIILIHLSKVDKKEIGKDLICHEFLKIVLHYIILHYD